MPDMYGNQRRFAEAAQARKDGGRAFRAGLSEDINPYCPHMDQQLYRRWQDGWRYARSVHDAVGDVSHGTRYREDLS